MDYAVGWRRMLLCIITDKIFFPVNDVKFDTHFTANITDTEVNFFKVPRRPPAAKGPGRSIGHNHQFVLIFHGPNIQWVAINGHSLDVCWPWNINTNWWLWPIDRIMSLYMAFLRAIRTLWMAMGHSLWPLYSTIWPPIILYGLNTLHYSPYGLWYSIYGLPWFRMALLQ